MVLYCTLGITNGNVVGGELARANCGASADHLIGCAGFMENNGVPIEAVSLQNGASLVLERLLHSGEADRFGLTGA